MHQSYLGHRVKRTPLERKTPLPPRSGYLKRGKPSRTRKVSKRFAKRRNPEYREFIRNFPCVLIAKQSMGSKCSGPTECAHVVSRGAGGWDVGDTVPLCRAHHRQQHTTGILSFQKLYGSDLKRSATLLADMWQTAKGLGHPEHAGGA